MVCLHGFMDTWRTWELVLPPLERRHNVLARPARSPHGRRAPNATSIAFEHIPAELLAHQVHGVAVCDAPAMIDCALREGYDLHAGRVGLSRPDHVGMSEQLLRLLVVSAVRYRCS
jgi:hypothetical protein